MKCVFFFVLYKPPRVGLEPTRSNLQSLENKALTENQNSVLATGLDILLQKYPELEQIITVWPELPEQVKNTIKELIQSYIKTIEKTNNYSIK